MSADQVILLLLFTGSAGFLALRFLKRVKKAARDKNCGPDCKCD